MQTIAESLTASTCNELIAFLAALETRPADIEPAAPANDNADNAPESILSIEAATLPPPVRMDARSLPQKERTALIRKVLQSAGVRGVSVTMARGSMCYWTQVRCDGIEHRDPDLFDDLKRCPLCGRNRAAEDKLKALILAALPDLGDRSDSRSDHFDFMFTVSVRR